MVFSTGYWATGDRKSLQCWCCRADVPASTLGIIAYTVARIAQASHPLVFQWVSLDLTQQLRLSCCVIRTMAFSRVSAHPLPFPPRDLQVLWDSLPQGMRRGLQTQGIDNAVLFRQLFDGTLDNAAAVAREFGGAREDAELLDS